MANATAALIREPDGESGPWIFDLPVKAATNIFEGTLVAQSTADGGLVPYSTATTQVCVGVAQHSASNSGGALGDKRCRVETNRVYIFTGSGFTEASFIGALVYGTDDHTVINSSNSQAREAVGFFMGMEPDGRVRVLVAPWLAQIVNVLQQLTDTPASADALRDNIVASFG